MLVAEPLRRYAIGFKAEGRGAQRLLVSEETVWKRGEEQPLLQRPGSDDRGDIARLTQTYLEQIQTNPAFRDIASFFAGVLYLHVAPQLPKYAGQLRGQTVEHDPFGQGLLEHVARTPEKTRLSRLERIEAALRLAIPQFSELKFVQDEATGQPHLEVRYKHFRANAGWQREEQWSDGTLRLFGLFWSLLEGNEMLLLEKPELSLNDAIVRQIPRMLQRIQRDKKRRRQIILSTHSAAPLSEPIDGRSILRLEAGDEGTKIMPPDESDAAALRAGLSPAEVILPKTRPAHADQLQLL